MPNLSYGVHLQFPPLLESHITPFDSPFTHARSLFTLLSLQMSANITIISGSTPRRTTSLFSHGGSRPLLSRLATQGGVIHPGSCCCCPCPRPARRTPTLTRSRLRPRVHHLWGNCPHSALLRELDHALPHGMVQRYVLFSSCCFLS